LIAKNRASFKLKLNTKQLETELGGRFAYNKNVKKKIRRTT